MSHNFLKQALIQNQFDLDEPQQKKLYRYLELIQQWNRVYNLTSITDFNDMVYLHLIDSLIISPYLQGTRFLDVGSGAGLPGIPLAILNPHQAWVLLDKNNKKTRFLTHVVGELHLPNIQVIHSRSEDFQPENKFDGIVSRALGTIKSFAETTAHLLAPTGEWLAMKGKYPEEELNELPDRFLVKKSVKLVIKGMNVERHLICLSKVNET